MRISKAVADCARDFKKPYGLFRYDSRGMKGKRGSILQADGPIEEGRAVAIVAIFMSPDWEKELLNQAEKVRERRKKK